MRFLRLPATPRSAALTAVIFFMLKPGGSLLAAKFQLSLFDTASITFPTEPDVFLRATGQIPECLASRESMWAA
jgi:hypothetical protein